MTRALALEEMVHLGDAKSRVTVVCSVGGHVEEEPLARAFAAVVARLPSLRSRVRQDGPYAFSFQPLETGPPQLQVRKGVPGSLREEINTPLPPDGGLVRGVLIEGADEDTFVLSIDHSITDGQSALAVCDAVWRGYTACVEGTFTMPQPEDDGDDGDDALPAALSARLPAHTPEDLAAYVTARGERMRGAPLVHLPYAAGESAAEEELPMRVARVRLDREQTAGVIGASKAAGVSVHGVLVAALLLAVRDAAGGAGTQRMSSMSPVDLRGRLSPPVHPEELFPAASLFFDVLDVREDADVLSLGRRLAENLREAIARGDLEREILAAAQVLRDPSLLNASLVTTNLGNVPVPETPDGLPITDVRCFALGDVSFPQAGFGPLVASVLTVRGQLDIELPYSARCFSAGQMEAIRTSVRGRLLALGS
ncbi:phthiocerol/phthiodiolone dimycocerosyl transferase family protein [Streptomyces sulphureus]|uniref:phthiocerol/phthiodiolone dimycocerosyl transferase family protein n=1 Tax=Streptomyces sulphureus TaxID=47758 RepID=UPI0003A1FFC2|nr:hypothetical protein [Streptomyces sulphureus]